MNDLLKAAETGLAALLREEGFQCACGKHHQTDLKEILIRSQALESIAELVQKYGGGNVHVFIVADKNTFAAAGEKVCRLLDSAGIKQQSFVFQQDDLQPNDAALGQVAMACGSSYDLILGVGSGTINDLGKLLAKVVDCPYINIATAPSMDGFASNSSSMVVEGLKVSVSSKVPIAIVADLDVLCRAPHRLIQAGFGDMVAKYTSICEWRISQAVTGEYYCETVASLIRFALGKCLSLAPELRQGQAQAVQVLMESLILTGIAMSFAGVTRPASGIEHYFSHIWDMRALEFQTPQDFHGIQCGVGTVLSLQIYEKIKGLTPNRDLALAYVAGFDQGLWGDFLKSFLGKSGQGLLDLEKKERKYDRKAHTKRLKVIFEKWEEILAIIAQELPSSASLQRNLESIGAPTTPYQIGILADVVEKTFLVTKDIRDKYNASRLLWDLGYLDEVGRHLREWCLGAEK